MARQPKTIERLEAAVDVLRDHHPMTVRQVYYQLVSRQVIKNNRSMYQSVSDLLVAARKDGTIAWDYIEDRLRRPRTVSMWRNLPAFAQTALAAYRRDVWQTQAGYVEVWLEKDALSGIFEDVLHEYGVTLNVGRGFDGWDSIRNAAMRYETRYAAHGGNITVLYFGDFDPSGEDMARSLRERLRYFGVSPHIIKCALTMDDIRRYDLPTDFTKATDTRSAAFIVKHGDVSVELDALPTSVLRERLITEVESRLDLVALERVREAEKADRVRLTEALHAA